MTMKNKQQLITEVVSLLNAMIEVEEESPQITESKQNQTIEMLTIRECSETIKGLSEHTVRQLVSQEKIPYIRTGQGHKGKILISKSALLNYFGGVA